MWRAHQGVSEEPELGWLTVVFALFIGNIHCYISMERGEYGYRGQPAVTKSAPSRTWNQWRLDNACNLGAR
jgi:hypothetical protein